MSNVGTGRRPVFTPNRYPPVPEPLPVFADTADPAPVGAGTPAPHCDQCAAPRAGDAAYCGECGFIFATGPAAPVAELPEAPVAGRYRLIQLLGERNGVARFRGEDVGTDGAPLPVLLVRQALPTVPPAAGLSGGPGTVFEFELPLDETGTAEHQTLDQAGRWPDVEWEQGVLMRAGHLSLPRIIDGFTEDGFAYLVEEVPAGTPLWDAWDRAFVTDRERFGWLVQLAEAIHQLHGAGAILEGLRPEMIVISPGGVAILADLGELLPLPLPADVLLRGGFSTAPELLLEPTAADGRADLYAFGALVYALVMGHELTDLDFTLSGHPKGYVERVPDANPFLVRLLAKTFVREPYRRFPTGERTSADGFEELIAALKACQRNLDRVKLDVAAWSTIGIVRTSNEDAVSVTTAAEARLDDTDEYALVLLADGMGGMESGEVAAGLTLRTLHEQLTAGPPFPPRVNPAPMSGDTPTAELPALPGTDLLDDGLVPWLNPAGPGRTTEEYADRIRDALRVANHRVSGAAQAGLGGRGMGCTAEVVLIDGPTAVIGHVGDSRVYHMRRGKVTLVTQDQTLVARLVSLGQLTPDEAEVHPRRAELQQAIGGRPELFPDLYSVALEPGDWLLVCSDGLSNQVPLPVIESVLRDARTAERAARRLVNLALYDGAADNVTVAVVRVA
jgi:serine/threonine protein phosphatase PrpC